MSNFTDFIGGAGGGGTVGRKYVDLIILDRSTTWSPRQDCKAVVTVIGGGGSGALTSRQSLGASGGGAGGLAQSDVIDLSASTTYTATVGSGGAPKYKYGGTSTQSGGAGGNSVFSGSDITTLTGNGGSGGATGTTATNGGSGGSASGGLYNYTGGAGGNAYSYSCGGGGAVNVTGTAYAGGDYTGGVEATGGAGTGSSPYSTGLSSQSTIQGGKAAIYSVVDFDYMIPKYVNPQGVNGTIDTITNTSYNAYSIIGFLDTPAMGVGGNGLSYQRLRATIKAQNGGMFAGGGAALTNSGSSFVISANAGDGGIFGGGGGGIRHGDGASQLTMSGAGGDGVVFIAVTEYL